MFHQQALRRLSRSAADETFLNPVLPGFNPDPSIIRVKKDYFLTTSSFEYTPGAPIYHSTDLIQWTLIGHALTRKSQLDIKAPEPGGGIWACTLRYHNGWFYLTTCVWDRYRPQDSHERAWPRGFYVKTMDIWNSDSWTDPVYFDQPGFDQDLFWDEDGKVYLSTTYRKVNRDPESKLLPSSTEAGSRVIKSSRGDDDSTGRLGYTHKRVLRRKQITEGSGKQRCTLRSAMDLEWGISFHSVGEYSVTLVIRSQRRCVGHKRIVQLAVLVKHCFSRCNSKPQ